MVSVVDAGEVKEGAIVAGKYRIDKVLGAGGMGVVVAAHHLQLDERVAIKFLLPGTATNGEAVARFAREARAAVKIQSEHVARVSDVGTLEDGAPYMVMEYLEGLDLSAWLKQQGALPIEQAVDFVLQACEAIAEAHSIGIIHRDLKPANLFVIRRRDGALSVKVLDFGISKATGLGGADMTHTAAVMGSPLYMSPEQMHSSKDVDARSDIWALGIILYELLVGDTPFLSDTMPGLIYKIVSEAPEPLRLRRPEVPEQLELAIARCLQKTRQARYESVASFANALLPFAPQRSRISMDRISGVLRGAGIPQVEVTQPLPPRSASSAQAPRTDEVQPQPREAAPAPAAAAAQGQGTGAAWGQTARGEKTARSKTAGLLVGGAAISGAIVAVAFLFRGHSAATATPAVQPEAASVSAPAATQPAVLVAPTAAPSASVSSSAAAVPSAAPPTRAPASAIEPPKNHNAPMLHQDSKASTMNPQAHQDASAATATKPADSAQSGATWGGRL